MNAHQAPINSKFKTIQVNEYDCLLLEHAFGNRPDDAPKVLAHVLEAGRARIVPRIEHDNWDERGIFNILSEYELWLKERT